MERKVKIDKINRNGRKDRERQRYGGKRERKVELVSAAITRVVKTKQ